ncbi:hypothetical protein L2E82_01472 [Cichorium intybus]|uniref:Uncharacterized protein n=1 Tax=Cichorium intybus TaxID=13427 RepID=A0ACB9GYY9_CICIN|nr:hypothetical protein L2E82_01472 [Cichorium intybus]
MCSKQVLRNISGGRGMLLKTLTPNMQSNAARAIVRIVDSESNGEIKKRGRKGKDRNDDEDNRKRDGNFERFPGILHEGEIDKRVQRCLWVLVKESSHVRTITLNRPKQQNDLPFEMVFLLLELFHAYEENPDVKLIRLKS